MWDDIIIGDGEKFNSAYGININGEQSGISENKSSYWISDAYLNLGLTIFKNTKEGKNLTKLIKQKNIKKIKHYLECLVIKNCSVEKLKDFIQEVIEKSFKNGKEASQKEVRIALGLDTGETPITYEKYYSK